MFISNYNSYSVRDDRLNQGAIAICSDLSNKIVFIVEFLKNYQIWKLSLCFIPKVTFCVLSVSTCQFSCHSAMYFSLRENVKFGVRVPWLVGHSNSNEGGGSLWRIKCIPLYIYIYIYIYIHSIWQKWVHPSHFCKYFIIYFHVTTLKIGHFASM